MKKKNVNIVGLHKFVKKGYCAICYRNTLKIKVLSQVIFLEGFMLLQNQKIVFKKAKSAETT